LLKGLDEPCSSCRLPQMLSGTQPTLTEYEYEWDDYLNTWVSGSDSIIRWSDGSRVFFRYLRDSSQKKQQEEMLKSARRTAEIASDAKSSFLANMSHEIRTPMNAILGITEIQLQDETLPPNISDALGKIYNSGEILLNIINDILDLSKIEAGKLELSPIKYEVSSLINDTVSLNLMRIGSKAIRFELSVDPDTPSSLIGDDLRIKQILNNLLSNAFKYTQKGKVILSVSSEELIKNENSINPEYDDLLPDASTGNADMTMVFTVSDTGQGMTEEQIDKLFDKYTRFNEQENRKTEGTGLGMNITRNLVNLMNGRITVKSAVNQGSVFTVYLPQKKTDSGVIGKELAGNLEQFNLNSVKKNRRSQIVYEPMPYGSVLIVDDVESNLYVARGLMAPYGLTIDTAADGFQAIEKIKEGKVYDIIFMDHMMPNMNGIEATEKIRSSGYTQPIIALTANAVSGQANLFLENGFDGFISKPIDIRQLNTVLKHFIRDKQPFGILEQVRQTAEEQKIKKANMKPFDQKFNVFFVKDAQKAIDTLEKILAKGNPCSDEDIQSYIINTHGMKSPLKLIGETELAQTAEELEKAGRGKNMAVIESETPAFLDGLRAVIAKLTPSKKNADTEHTGEDRDYLREKLITVKEACENYDKRVVKAAITRLEDKTWSDPIQEQLDLMEGLLLGGDFGEVSNVAEKIIQMVSWQ
ncbi:MAG: ATP-binding protein, partial [Treponema sp.]|nr:ATP-binding protein [Treponema sp.]